MSIIALAFTSCDNYDFISPDGQMNPQEALLLTENVTKAATVGTDLSSGALNLNDFKESPKGINVINFGEIAEFPAGYTLALDMELSRTEDFAKPATLPVTMDGLTAGYIDANDWNAAHVANISKGPKTKTVYYRFIVYAVNGAEKVKLGEGKTFLLTNKADVTPYPSDLKIEEAYYILGTINSWSVADAVQLNHEGDDVYDNPVFTIMLDLKPEDVKNGWRWKIVPKSTKDHGDWLNEANSSYGVAVDGDDSMEGMLVGRTATDDCGAGCIKQAGQWILTINLEDGTYKISSAVDYLYTPGKANEWHPDQSEKLFTSDYTNYEGFARLHPDGFKFASAPDWDHTNYGATGTEGTLSIDPSAGNLSVASAGLYYCRVNIATLTYTTYGVKSIGVVGDATPGAWDNSTELTPSADMLTWTGDVALGATGEFKFRANNAWDVNLGGDLKNLTPGGNNIATPGAGVYTITLNLGTIPYTATVVKK